MKCNPFSIMTDESDDKTDKLCIILVRFLEESMRALGVPVMLKSFIQIEYDIKK